MAMKRAFFIILMGFVCVTCCLAQVVDLNKRITTIKRDTTYLYAEATMKTADEAMAGAKAILEVTVSDWVRSQHPSEEIELCIAKAKNHCIDMQTRRGSYYRVFVYVKKSDIMPIADQREMMVISMDSTHAISPAKEAANVSPVLSHDEQQMAAIDRFYKIEPYVKGLRDSLRLEAYGKYATLPADTTACHLFVYDQEGVVRAVLRKAGGTYLNLRTLKVDDVRNYTNCGAIWFRMKK